VRLAHHRLRFAWPLAVVVLIVVAVPAHHAAETIVTLLAR